VELDVATVALVPVWPLGVVELVVMYVVPSVRVQDVDVVVLASSSVAVIACSSPQVWTGGGKMAVLARALRRAHKARRIRTVMGTGGVAATTTGGAGVTAHTLPRAGRT